VGQGVLIDIAARVGTPVYVYDVREIHERYQGLDSALADVAHRIHYAVKANGNLALLSQLRCWGAGADIVSAGELTRVLQAGFDPGDVVFSGAGKTRDELRTALRLNVGCVNVESAREAAHLGALADEEARTQAVAIRVNPDVPTETHPYTRTGELGMKFGVPHAEVPTVARAIAANARLNLVGLAMHIGSQIFDVAPFREATRRLVALTQTLRSEGHEALEHLDVGGGIGVPYQDGPDVDLAAYVEAVASPVAAAGLSLVVEPGRYLVANAGLLLTRVLYRKESGRRSLAIVDAGMTELLRPSHYDAYHGVTVVSRGAEERPIEVVDIVGPACETGDFLALERPLPRVEEDDLLAVHSAGAYGFVMASNYNARPRPPEVIRDGARWALVRDREALSALIAGEIIEPTSWQEVGSE
jgi:diaminopimelate decarboxylase